MRFESETLMGYAYSVTDGHGAGMILYSAGKSVVVQLKDCTED